MPKEYRTIQEVAGPLMLVRGVENVTYNELGEIELASGEKRRCKVLEIDGGNALVQLFEDSTGINLSNSKVRFLGRPMELGVSEDMLSQKLPPGIHPDRCFRYRRPEYAGPRPEAAHFLRLWSAPRQPCCTDCPAGAGARHHRAFCRRIRGYGYHF